MITIKINNNNDNIKNINNGDKNRNSNSDKNSNNNNNRFIPILARAYPNPCSGQRTLALIGSFERAVILC